MKRAPSNFDFFCWPLSNYLRRRRYEAKKRREVLRELPIKGRELTLRLEYGLSVAGSQPQSKLMMALPLEIRRLIYKQCLGGHKINLGLWAGAYIQLHNCRRGLLCLALTCRQVYSESINLLYEENEFLVYMGQHPFSLSRVLPPRRLQHFRNLTIGWELTTMPNHGDALEEHWVATWENLRAFTGTKMLRVQMVDRIYPSSDWIFQTKVQENITATMRSPTFEIQEIRPGWRNIIVLSPGVQVSGGSQVLGVD